MLDASCTNSIADKTVGSRSQCVDRNQQYDINTSDDIGNCQFPLSQPFYGYEENKLGSHRQEILQHGEAGDTKNPHQQCWVECAQAVHTVFL